MWSPSRWDCSWPFWEPRICIRCAAHWDAVDRLALAVFAPLGAEKALLWGAESTLTLILVAAFLGFLTGAGGGVLRDLLRMRLPMALLTPYGSPDYPQFYPSSA